MQRIISITSTILFLAIAGLAGCGAPGGEEVPRGNVDTTTGRASTFSGNVTVADSASPATMNDTVIQYHRGATRSRIEIFSTDTVGVLFSPPVFRRCLLRVVFIEFDSSATAATATGLIYRASSFRAGSIPTVDTPVAAFPIAIPPSNAPRIVRVDLEGLGIRAEDRFSDLLIAVTPAPNQQRAIVMTGSDTLPASRSFIFRRAPTGLSARRVLPFNVAARTGFNCVRIPDTTFPVTFTLRWATKRTDLDLYLIRPGGDTIYWNRRMIVNDSLDGDDINGEGPEDILYNAPSFQGGERPIELAVHYAAPSGGPATKATVFFRLGTSGSTRIGTCTLQPGDWWIVGRFDPMQTLPTSNESTCKRQPAPGGIPKK